MADSLLKLPTEILDIVFDNLRGSDLKVLSQTSKAWHSLVATRSWQCVRVVPSSEHHLYRIPTVDLPQERLQRVKQLHFRAGVQSCIQDRCPHDYDRENDIFVPMEGHVKEEYEHSHFVRLTRAAKSLIERLGDNQLEEFSWDLGTCVSFSILGERGILALKQPLIQSLSLTTYSPCYFVPVDEYAVNLTPFRHLRSLTWKSPGPDHFDTLSTAIEINSSHLQKLVIDFVDWWSIKMEQRYSDAEKSDGHHVYDPSGIEMLCLNYRFRQPLLTDICVLSLTEVPIRGATVEALNFATLRSLTLRNCHGWAGFLKNVLNLGISIKLTTLEFQETNENALDSEYYTLLNFLDAFTGLEELFVSYSGRHVSRLLWESIAGRHTTTLKRFAHHQRLMPTRKSRRIPRSRRPLRGDEESYSSEDSEESHDLPNLFISRQYIHKIVECPTQNPLGRLGLECIGLACVPKRLSYLLRPFAAKTSLKFIHIRQSASDIRKRGSWALTSRHSRKLSGTSTKSSGSIEETVSRMRISDENVKNAVLESQTDHAINKVVDPRRALHSDLSHFLKWAFGPKGISSLQMIVFGDFAYGGRAPEYNLVFGRKTDEKDGFRVVEQNEQEWLTLLVRYRNLLEACAQVQLFDT